MTNKFSNFTIISEFCQFGLRTRLIWKSVFSAEVESLIEKSRLRRLNQLDSPYNFRIGSSLKFAWSWCVQLIRTPSPTSWVTLNGCLGVESASNRWKTLLLKNILSCHFEMTWHNIIIIYCKQRGQLEFSTVRGLCMWLKVMIQLLL